MSKCLWEFKEKKGCWGSRWMSGEASSTAPASTTSVVCEGSVTGIVR